MFIYLFDRSDRLGANITNYITQILFAYNNGYLIKFKKKKENYKYYNSIFTKVLFYSIEIYNKTLLKNNNKEDILKSNEYIFNRKHNYINTTSNVLKNIKTDFITFFYNNIYKDTIPLFTTLSSSYNIPFDVNNSILVHLRLDDVANKPDYNGSISSKYYKNKIKNNQECGFDIYDKNELHQAPLSKKKLDKIISKAEQEFPNYKIILITSPSSDTTYLNYNYEIIKSNDENLDLYLLTMCNVTILSRSTFALSSLFFNNNKIKTYIPLWSHFVCCGLDTIYDKLDRSKIEYFV